MLLQNPRRLKIKGAISRTCFGLRLVVGRVMPIVFGQKFLNDPTRKAQREEWKQHLIANDDRIGINRAVTGVVERDGVYDELGKITVPTLIIVGD